MEAYKKVIGVSTIVVTLLVIPFLVYFFFIKSPSSPRAGGEASGPSPDDSSPSTVIPAEAPGEKGTVDKEEPAPLAVQDIELNTSDEPVRELAKNCSLHPEFVQWLKNQDIIRRGVAIVDNISNGASPAPLLQFLTPPHPFKVIRKNGQILLDPASYIRYQPIAMVLVSLEVEESVKVYRQLLPLIEEAYRELGYPGKRFPEALDQAIDILLKIPFPEGDILLEEKVTTYIFADPRLEGLNDAQKHLLRMGPENVRKIQAKLREIKKGLAAPTQEGPNRPSFGTLIGVPRLPEPAEHD